MLDLAYVKYEVFLLEFRIKEIRKYNENTKEAVMRFQKDNNLDVDGIAGPKTNISYSGRSYLLAV